MGFQEGLSGKKPHPGASLQQGRRHSLAPSVTQHGGLSHQERHFRGIPGHPTAAHGTAPAQQQLCLSPAPSQLLTTTNQPKGAATGGMLTPAN